MWCVVVVRVHLSKCSKHDIVVGWREHATISLSTSTGNRLQVNSHRSNMAPQNAEQDCIVLTNATSTSPFPIEGPRSHTIHHINPSPPSRNLTSSLCSNFKPATTSNQRVQEYESRSSSQDSQSHTLLTSSSIGRTYRVLDLASLVANGILCGRGTGARVCVAVLCNLCVTCQS